MRNQNDREKQAGSGRKAAFSDRKAFSGAKRSAGERRPGGADRFSGERRSFDRTRPSGEKRFSETKRFQEGGRDAERRRMPEEERPAGGTRGSYHEYEYAPVSCGTSVPGETAQRDGEESYILTGRNPIREALKNDRDLEKLLVQKGDLSGSAMEIIHMAKERKIMVQVVDKSRLDEIDPHHQGLIAFASAFHYAEVEDMLRLAEERQEAPFLILLDGITDPHNLGAIIRTAECVGAHGVIVPQHRNVGLTPAAVKASAGAVEYLPVARVTNINRTIGELQKRNIWVYALTMNGTDYRQVSFSGGTAIVIGAEGSGISRLTEETCDQSVSLPMQGHIDSLNASVAAGVIMYRVMASRENG